MASTRFLLAKAPTCFQSICWRFTNSVNNCRVSVTSVFQRRSFYYMQPIFKLHIPDNTSTSFQNAFRCQNISGLHCHHTLNLCHTNGLSCVDSLPLRCISTKAKRYPARQPVSSRGRNIVRRNCSSKRSRNEEDIKDGSVKEAEVSEETLSVFARFKKAYKEHGKVLIGVHLATSTIWLGSFYFAARSGIDVIPILEKLGAGETIITPFKSSGLGDIAVAYLLYKLATPARYTVTLGGTNIAIRYLRNKGHMKPIEEGNRLRELYADGKTELKLKQDKIKIDLKRQRKEQMKKLREIQKQNKNN